MEQPRGQREAGCRAAGKVAEAPTKPQGTEKTTIHNQAAGRGESQEDQPTPRTKPEERTGRAPREKQKSWTPPGRWERANRKITSQELRDTNRNATRKMARDNTSYDGSKARHRSQQGIAPGARRLEEEEPRERERSGPRRMKRRTGTWSARQKQAESEHSTRQKTTNSPQGPRATGTRATRPPTETKRPGKRTPNLASHEVATGAVETKKNRPNRTRRQKGGPRKTTSQQRNTASGSHQVWSVHAQPKTERHDD